VRIALTGGGGFLGRAVCRAWIERGVSPKDLTVVSRSRHPLLDELGVAHRVASVTDPEALRRAFAEVDLVYHLAGLVSRDPRDAGRMRAIHVDGTRNALQAASAAGVRRVVYASSTGTFGCTRDPSRVPHEDGPDAAEIVSRWAYYRTKLEAERLALAPQPEGDTTVIVLNPSLILGPGDVDGSSTNDVRDFLQGRMPVIARGGVNFVDVRDAAAAFVTAADAGEPGARHLLGAENVTVEELVDRLSRLTGVRVPKFSPPAGLQVLASAALAPMARLLGREPMVDPATAAMAQLHWFASGERARKVLGFVPRTADETLADTVGFLRGIR